MPLRAAETFVRVSQRDPRYLELSDGSPYVPIGLNLVAPSKRDAEAGLLEYQGWLDKLALNGGNYVRAWLSERFWEVEHAHERGIRSREGPAHRRPSGHGETAQHPREVDAGALPQHRRRPAGLGRQAAAQRCRTAGPATSIADFFDGETSRNQFRKKLDWYAGRFGNRPEVFAWELWNEINAVRGGKYLEWTEAMLPELHRRFPRNLCVQSLGSFDTTGVRPTTSGIPPWRATIWRRYTAISTWAPRSKCARAGGCAGRRTRSASCSPGTRANR
jgi:hypothetical protein